jgi:hypothetical protein
MEYNLRFSVDPQYKIHSLSGFADEVCEQQRGRKDGRTPPQNMRPFLHFIEKNTL